MNGLEQMAICHKALMGTDCQGECRADRHYAKMLNNDSDKQLKDITTTTQFIWEEFCAVHMLREQAQKMGLPIGGMQLYPLGELFAVFMQQQEPGRAR
jgi:hypothetical protein